MGPPHRPASPAAAGCRPLRVSLGGCWAAVDGTRRWGSLRVLPPTARPGASLSAHALSLPCAPHGPRGRVLTRVHEEPLVHMPWVAWLWAAAPRMGARGAAWAAP